MRQARLLNAKKTYLHYLQTTFRIFTRKRNFFFSADFNKASPEGVEIKLIWGGGGRQKNYDLPQCPFFFSASFLQRGFWIAG